MSKKRTGGSSAFRRWAKGVSGRDYFGAVFPDDEFDTLAGLVTNALGHLPQRGEIAEIGIYQFKILRADSRRIHLMSIRLQQEDSGDGD